MHYYDIGAEFNALVNGKRFQIRVDDVTSCDFEREAPALFWVNPPLTTGGLHKFQRRAAKVTEGVRRVGLKQIYEAVAGMVQRHEYDGFVWMMPEIDGIDKLLDGLCLGDIPWSPGTYRKKKIRILADGVPVKPLVHVNWTDDPRKNFIQLFGENPDLSDFKCIVDPCAGYSPMARIAIKHGLGYHGIEVNSFEAFRSLKFIRPHATEINEPVVRSGPPSGVVIGADDGPTHKPVSELRDFKEGRTFKEIHERIAAKED